MLEGIPSYLPHVFTWTPINHVTTSCPNWASTFLMPLWVISIGILQQWICQGIQNVGSSWDKRRVHKAQLEDPRWILIYIHLPNNIMDFMETKLLKKCFKLILVYSIINFKKRDHIPMMMVYLAWGDSFIHP